MIKDVRKVKPYPYVPPEFQEEPSEPTPVNKALIWAVKFFVAVWLALMVLSGMFLWSLII